MALDDNRPMDPATGPAAQFVSSAAGGLQRGGAVTVVVLVGIALALSVAPLLVFGPSIIDDAYITFRYACNLAGGAGFVYNRGDSPVLGTSTPLFTLLIATLVRAGLPATAAALGLSVVGGTLALVSGALLLGSVPGRPRTDRLTLAMAVTTWMGVLSTSPEWVFAMLSGMETALFVGLSLAALAAAARGRPVAAGIAAGLAVLTRYDGWALVVVLGGWSVAETFRRRSECRRMVWLAPLIAAAMQLPWLVYALLEFGDYAPHSVAAKRIIHERPPMENLLTQLRYFAGGLRSGMVGARVHPHLLVMFCLGVATSWFWRRPGALLLLGWAALSVAGFTAARILIQPWYLVAELSVYVWVSVFGLWSLVGCVGGRLRARSRHRRRVRLLLFGGAVLVAAVLVVLQARMLLRDAGRWPEVRVAREKAYFKAADIVRERGDAGDSVLVGEVGVLGYALPDFRILDSAGINSPEILDVRRSVAGACGLEETRRFPPELGDPEWVRRVLSQTRPRFIVSIEVLLRLGQLADTRDFQRLYEPVAVVRNAPSPPVFVFERVGDRVEATPPGG